MLEIVHVCQGINMRIVKFQMGSGEETLESKIPSGYVHAGHTDLTAFLEQDSSMFLPHILFAFRGKNSHESIKPNDEACMRLWDGRREFVLSENVLNERGFVFRGDAYALLVESK